MHPRAIRKWPYLGNEDIISVVILTGPLLVQLMQLLRSNSVNYRNVYCYVRRILGLGQDACTIPTRLESDPSPFGAVVYELVGRSNTVPTLLNLPKCLLARHVDYIVLDVLGDLVNLDCCCVDLH